VVNGVLSGEFEVGFIRTDQIERSKDADGNAIDPNLFRIIDPKQDLAIDGEPFPFSASTALYPEWNIAALSHVAEDVSRELQSAMIVLSEHAKVGEVLHKCREEQNINDTSSICEDVIFSDDFKGNYTVRCDTTPEVADIALDAMRKGKYAGWQTTLSYMQLRSMQEATGFISMDPATRVWRCIRSTEIYDSISCPSGYYRKSKEDVDEGCSREDLECGEGYQCLCSPCALIKLCVDAVEFNGKCVAYNVFLPSLLVPIFVVSAILVYCYVDYRRKQSDSVWAVQTSQLKFDDPPIVVGVGTFGLVLLAEYRGTAVAVKRVIPTSSAGSKMGGSWFDRNVNVTESLDDDTDPVHGDIENRGLKSMSPAMIGRARIYGSLSSTASGRRQNQRQLKADFVREMRHLAKLRHPCITTVMGAVISRVEEPMLVMEYMNYGSFHDVLHNDSIGLDIEEHILPILQDVAQGMRFLHAASPRQVVHGDLKAKNVLIDSNYRAKVSDFGLSAKKRIGASGTPFWMAPELLRGESLNSSKSDMYAFGILIYEAYSRKTPYEGEDPNEVIKAIMNPAMMKRPPVPLNSSARVAEMMKECLVPNPNDRPTSEQVDLSLRVEGGVKERTTRLETLNRELAEANMKIASASAMQLVSTVS
jgi:serine/threonine protein kinase